MYQKEKDERERKEKIFDWVGNILFVLGMYQAITMWYVDNNAITDMFLLLATMHSMAIAHKLGHSEWARKLIEKYIAKQLIHLLVAGMFIAIAYQIPSKYWWVRGLFIIPYLIARWGIENKIWPETKKKKEY